MTPQSFPFNIKTIIACEDIREERLGKHTLVGVYSGDGIKVSQMPGNIAIACFMEIEITKPGVHDLNLRLSGPGDHNALLKAQMNFESALGNGVIATPRIDLLIDEEGIFRLDIGSDELGWVNLITRKITLDPSISTSPLRPSEQSQPGALEKASPNEPSPPPRGKRRARL